MSPPEAAPTLTPAQRRANVRRVQEAAAELADVENALADVIARAPALLTKVQHIRERIEGVMAAAEPKEKTEDE